MFFQNLLWSYKFLKFDYFHKEKKKKIILQEKKSKNKNIFHQNKNKNIFIKNGLFFRWNMND